MQFTPFTVHDIVHESEDIRTFRLEPKDGALPAFKPGNFFILALPDETGKRAQRPYSIASLPGEGYLQFCIALKGAFTHLLWKLKKGDSIDVAGPFGLFALAPTDTERVFIAGGVGISPLRAMLLQYPHIGKLGIRFRELPLHAFAQLAPPHLLPARWTDLEAPHRQVA